MMSRRVIKQDIRKSGSGNPGATNMLRTHGFKWGLFTFLFDTLKGTIPALTAALLYGFETNSGQIALYACGFCVVVGHCFPVIYKFRGGKGVSTIVGVMFIANPIVSTISFAGALAYFAVFEYGAMTSFIFITPVIAWKISQEKISLVVCLLLLCFFCLICYTHRKNIKRLLDGTENRAKMFTLKKKNK